MFRHQGTARTLKHNIHIATLLSFVAGVVNVAGFLSAQTLTTNVTGHFAFLMDEVYNLNMYSAFIYLLFIIFFLLGAFASSMMVEYMAQRNRRLIYVVPVVVESMILLAVSLLGSWWLTYNPNTLAFALLFAMGLQNALVTKISNAVVRTTHLTGLFTDLGIELSQLFFYHKPHQRTELLGSIGLRVAIIGSFFAGGVLGAILYSQIGLLVLSGAAGLLLLGLVADHWSLLRASARMRAAH